MAKQYTTRSGLVQWMPSARWIRGVCEADNSEGFCLACKGTQGGVEPDARRYKCEGCGELKVYGAEQLALMGLYHGKLGEG